MKLKMFCVLISLSFINIIHAQIWSRLAPNLKSYQSIYYDIDQKEERTCVFCPSSFTKELVDSKVEDYFKDNNISATRSSTIKYPMLLISVKDPVTGFSHDDSYNTINNYEVSFNLYDLIDNKTVIVYRCTFNKLKFSSDNTDEANSYWEDLDNCFSYFLKDWNKYH